VDLALAAAQKIDGHDGTKSSKKCAERSKERREGRGKANVRLQQQSGHRADARAAGYAQDERIGKWIAQKRLKAGTGDRKRCAEKRAKKDARQPDIKNDEPVVTGEFARLVQRDPNQIAPECIE